MDKMLMYTSSPELGEKMSKIFNFAGEMLEVKE